MKFKLLTLLLVSALTLNIACKKEDEEVNINTELEITFSPEDSNNMTPNTPPALVFNQKINYTLKDNSSNKYYKFIVDSVSIKTLQGNTIPFNQVISASNDFIKFIPTFDLSQTETYLLKFHYKVVIKINDNNIYETYVKNGVPQQFTYSKEFTVTDYPFFNPNFTAIQYPVNGTTSILLPPYYTFSHNIEKLYPYEQLKLNYRICIDSAGIYSQQGQPISSTFQISSSKDTLKIIPNQLLSYGNNYKTSFKYHIEIKKGSLNEYQLLKKDGKPYYGRIQNNISIDGSNFSIDTSQVEYAYPWPYQYHFLKNETTRGVLKLKNSTKQNFNAKGFTFFVRYTSTLGESWDVNATYDPANLKFIFQIPSDNLENQKIYKIEFIAMDAKKSLSVFLTYHFRTSMFNTFEEKINSIFYSRNGFLSLYCPCIDYIGSVMLLKHFRIQEVFDKAEGKAYDGLVRFNAYRDTSSRWVYRMYEYYDNFEKSTVDKNFRSNSPIKIPPTNAIKFNSNCLAPLLNNSQINSGIADNYIGADDNFQRLEFDLIFQLQSDWCTISKLVNQIQSPNQYDLIIRKYENYYGGYSGGVPYKFHIYYYAGDLITYTGDWVIYY